uniref:Uncharacterized protein n=1 Tax=Brassica campestris TaxID=3711 RepID=A0A3P6CF64_BRACM|nr:unnamed protein product [Brassica rapa]
MIKKQEKAAAEGKTLFRGSCSQHSRRKLRFRNITHRDQALMFRKERFRSRRGIHCRLLLM